VVVDEYEIPIRTDTPVGEYRIEIGIYRPETGERLPVLDEDGWVAGDRMLLREVTVR
jgi:hypothetical protein